MKHTVRLIQLSIVTVLILTSGANAEWIDNGTPICVKPGNQWGPKLVPDGLGGAIICWVSSEEAPLGYDVYAQRIDTYGNVQWSEDGSLICSNEHHQHYTQIVSNLSGGAFIFWHEELSGEYEEPELFVQQINADGEKLWGPDGIKLCERNFFMWVHAIPDSCGGVYVTWYDWSGGYGDVYCLRLDASGNSVWGEKLNLSPPDGPTDLGQQYSTLAPDGSGGVYVVWEDGRFGFDRRIFAQRVDSTGNSFWGGFGISIGSVRSADWQTGSFPKAHYDGQGGCIVVWKGEDQFGVDKIYLQRIDGVGNILWGTSGKVISETESVQTAPEAIINEEGNLIVTWVDYRLAEDRPRVYAQKFNLSGNPLWSEDGVLVGEADKGGAGDPQLISDGESGVYVTWVWESDVGVQHIDADGNLLWGLHGVAACNAARNQTRPRICSNENGGIIVAWTDDRNHNYDIYASNIDDSSILPISTALLSYSINEHVDGFVIDWEVNDVLEVAEFIIWRYTFPFEEATHLASINPQEGQIAYAYEDDTCEPNSKYQYRVDVLIDGTRVVLFETDEVTTPSIRVKIYQNIPNPFNPSTNISFYIPQSGDVLLQVFDVEGKRVRTLSDKPYDKGRHEVIWDGVSDSGDPVASGVYFYRLTTGKETISKKMVLLR
ncbi:MAG: T9SS type A sorting domain-containing protein [Bacteroidales bacterium]|nr:T9SS type A sorting domain-containing protein [Candidatus Latescibacterota bacterium]